MRFLYTEHHQDDDSIEISTSSLFIFCFVFSLCCMTGLLYVLLKKYNTRVIVEITDNIVIMEDAPKELKYHTYDDAVQYIPELCIICIDNYEDENIITTLSCNHSFHTKCLKEWIKKKNECPCCKDSI